MRFLVLYATLLGVALGACGIEQARSVELRVIEVRVTDNWQPGRQDNGTTGAVTGGLIGGFVGAVIGYAITRQDGDPRQSPICSFIAVDANERRWLFRTHERAAPFCATLSIGDTIAGLDTGDGTRLWRSGGKWWVTGRLKP